MPWDSLEPSSQFLGKAVHSYFVDLGVTTAPAVKIDQPITGQLRWRPTLWFKGTGHLIIAIEASPESPYPMALKINATDIAHVLVPITTYAVCPEEVYLSMQPDVKELRAHGSGLLTVDQHGNVTKQFGGHPLIQHISEEEFMAEIKGLHRTIIRDLREAFESYKNNPVSGMADLGEITEAATNSAKRAIIRKGWATEDDMGRALANNLNCMLTTPQLGNASPGIGRMRSYVAEYRNPSHHRPTSQKQAYKKYHECQHAFREGIKCLQSFTEQFKRHYSIIIKV